MSEEWTEVEAHGVRIRYAPSGDGGYRMQTRWGSQWVPGQSIQVQAVLFELGMEAARQEIREKLQELVHNATDDSDRERAEGEELGDHEQTAYADGMMAVVDRLVEILSPPDSETES